MINIYNNYCIIIGIQWFPIHKIFVQKMLILIGNETWKYENET